MRTPMDTINVTDDNDDELLILHSSPPNGTTKATAISVENYYNHATEDTDMQLAIMASITTNFINLSREHEYIDYYDFNTNIRKPNNKGISIREPGESSNASSKRKLDEYDSVTPFFMCEICVDGKPLSDSFRVKGCSHSYCSDCIQKYVGLKIQDNITRIPCPVSGCNGVLEPEHCRSVLPPEVFDRWGDALCEAMILASDKYYCPFKDCSALLVQDGEDISNILESECPICRRLFCAKCKVPWHSGVECGDFQKLHKDEREREDIMLMKLAKNKQWTRCPKCKYYVDKSSGCVFIKCRCGCTFCYNCGAYLINHYCEKCRL